MRVGILILLGSLLSPLYPAVSDTTKTTQPYWVFFRDKEVAGPQNFNPDNYGFPHLTPRAIYRRELRGRLPIYNYLDLDVSQRYIDSVLATGVHLRQVSRWFNAISVEATPQQIEQLSERPEIKVIKRVHKASRRLIKLISRDSIDVQVGQVDTGRYGYSYEQLAQIGAITAHDSGYTGAGIWVLMLDTGCRLDHEVFQPERVIATYDFIQHDSTISDQAGDAPGQMNHGTATASVLAGYKENQLLGVAYGCSLLLAKTEILDQEIQVEEDNYVAALEWGEALGADVASSSLGYLDWYTYEDMDGATAITTRAVDLAVALGMVCVTAAGNEGNSSWHYIIAPADADSVISCGAVDWLGELASFSSRGPTYDGRIKPEVVARGVNTYAAMGTDDYSYGFFSGTSLSTPLVGGAAALLLQAHPTWGPMEVREALMMTADRADSPDNDYGFGLINVWAAMHYTFTNGDLTGDGQINVNDVVLLIGWVLESDVNEEHITIGDLNSDGQLDVRDVVVLIDWALSL